MFAEGDMIKICIFDGFRRSEFPGENTPVKRLLNKSSLRATLVQPEHIWLRDAEVERRFALRTIVR